MPPLEVSARLAPEAPHGAKAPKKARSEGLKAENDTEIANLTVPGAVISQI